MPLKLLAIETAVEACSVALSIEDEVTELSEATPRMQSKRLLPMVEEILAQAGVPLRELDGFVFSVGPGSFTGLRIGAGIVAGLAYGVDKPIVPVSTLQCLAQRAYLEQGVTASLVATDARMGEVYAGIYCLQDESALMQPLVSDFVAAPEQAFLETRLGGCKQSYSAVGQGWVAYSEQMCPSIDRNPELLNLIPSAKFLLPVARNGWQQGKKLAAFELSPTYCRNEVAKKAQVRE